MKHYLLILYGLIALGFSSKAQSPMYCAQQTCSNPVIAGSFPDWDWTNQDPCNWIANATFGQNLCVKPPFASTTNRVGSMVNVMTNYDYLNANPLHANTGVPVGIQKDQGWELVAVSFSGWHPYFILYNKYSGTIRSYFYIPDYPAPALLSGYAIVCAFDGVNEGAAVLASSNFPIMAMDQYHDGPSADMIVKSISITTPDSWLCADFTAMYDSDIGDLIANNKLRIQLYGIQDFGITLKGTAISPYGTGNEFEMVGKSSGFVGGVLSAEAANAKLKSVLTNALAITTALDAKVTTINNTSHAALTLKNNLQLALAGNFVNLLTSVSKISGIFSAAVGIFKTFVGTVSTPASAPDVASAYNIDLQGSMTLQTPLGGGSFKIPGTSGSSPVLLYNCPMGRINLSKTPTIMKSNVYSRENSSKGAEWFWAYWNFGYIAGFTKCRLDENLELVENLVKDHQGNTLVRNDIKFAIKLQASEASSNENNLWYDIFNPIIKSGRYRKENVWGFFTYETFTVPNPIKKQLDDGIFILHDYVSDGSHIYGTPYMSAEDLKGVTFEIPTKTNVTLAVMATYKNVATGAVYIFSNNYTVDLVQTSVSGPNRIYDASQHPTFPFSDYYATLPVNLVFDSPYRDFMLPHDQINTASEIAMIPGFASSTGYGAVAIDPYIHNGGFLDITTSIVSNTCEDGTNRATNFNSDVTAPELLESASVFPNPTNGDFTIRLKYPEERLVKITVQDMLGTTVYSQDMGVTNEVNSEISLPGLSNGIYLLNIWADGEWKSEKISIVE